MHTQKFIECLTVGVIFIGLLRPSDVPPTSGPVQMNLIPEFNFLRSPRPDSSFTYMMHYLKYREGLEYYPKPCPAGFSTVGYGHNLAAHGYEHVEDRLDDGKMTYKEASAQLRKDFQRTYEDLKTQLPHLSKNQLYAVAGLVLNCGEAKVKYNRGKKSLGYTDSWKRLLKGEMPRFKAYTIYKPAKSKGYKKSFHLKQSRAFEEVLFTNKAVKFPLRDGKSKLMTVAEIGKYYQERIIARDILPAKAEGMYE